MITREEDRSDEADLVRKAKAGDPVALRTIVEMQAPRVAGLLTRLLGPRGDLEDWVQTVFLEMCRALPSFRGDSQLSTFIGGITVRVARRALRPSAYEARRADWPEQDLASDADVDQERATIRREQLRRIHALVEGMKPKKRIAFLLATVEGMTPREIAEAMGCTLFTARARVYHAKKELKERAQADPYLASLVKESP